MKDLDGQVAFGGFSFADELWTTQPADVIRRSYAAGRRAFEDAGIALSPVVAGVAGQFGMGLGDVLPAGSLAILPRAAWERGHPDESVAPAFLLSDTTRAVVSDVAWTENGVELEWSFDGDGALLASGGIAPVRGIDFALDPGALAEYEASLADRAAAGFDLTTIAAAYDGLQASGFAPPPLPPTLDTVGSAGGAPWLGEAGTAGAQEADGALRRAWAAAHRDVRAAEALAQAAGEFAPPDITEAWDALLRAGIASASGPSPLRAAVLYARNRAAAARRLVLPRLEEAAGPCLDHVLIRGRDGTVGCVGAWGAARRDADDLLEGVSARAGDDGGLILDVQQLEDPDLSGDPLLLRVRHTFGVDLDAGGPLSPRRISLPFTTDVLRFVPAGRTGRELEPFVEVPAVEPIVLPLGGGVLDLGDPGHLVLDPRHLNLGVFVLPDEDRIEILDATPGIGGPEIWELYVVESRADALRLAERLVQRPDLYFPVPRTGLEADPIACDCTSSLGPNPTPTIVLCVAILRARRRRDP
jgi:hypothetical protein